VESMRYMFYNSKFKRDLTEWQPINLADTYNMFTDNSSKIPYWVNYEDAQERRSAIYAYHLKQELENKNKQVKRIKI
jgi:hypothetical protein